MACGYMLRIGSILMTQRDHLDIMQRYRAMIGNALGKKGIG